MAPKTRKLLESKPVIVHLGPELRASLEATSAKSGVPMAEIARRALSGSVMPRPLQPGSVSIEDSVWAVAWPGGKPPVWLLQMIGQELGGAA